MLLTKILCFCTGNFAHKFFEESNREHVLELYEFDDDVQKENFRLFLQAISVTLRVVSSTEKINVEKFRSHNIATNLVAVDMFSFMKS